MLVSASWARPAAPPSLQKVAVAIESLHISLNAASSEDRFQFPCRGPGLWGMIQGKTALCPKSWAKGRLLKVWEAYQGAGLTSGVTAWYSCQDQVGSYHHANLRSTCLPQKHTGGGNDLPSWYLSCLRVATSPVWLTILCQRLQWVSDPFILLCILGLCCRSLWLSPLLAGRMITLPGVGRKELGSGVHKLINKVLFWEAKRKQGSIPIFLREYLKKEEDRLSIISMGEGGERVVCKSCSLEAEAVVSLFHMISKRRHEEGTWSSHGHILSGEGWRFILSQAQECPGGTLSRDSKAGSKEMHPALSASFLSSWMVHPHLCPVCDRQYSWGPVQPVLIHCPERLGQGHTLPPRRATEGSSNPNSSLILSSSVPRYWASIAGCKALDTRAGMAPVLTDLELATSDLSLMVFLLEPTGMMTPSSSEGNCHFFQNPKGLAPYLGFKIFTFCSEEMSFLHSFHQCLVRDSYEPGCDLYSGCTVGNKIEKNNLYPAAAAKSLQLCPTLCDPIDGA